MAEYDNSNTGATFPPFEEQRMILQGRIRVEGRQSKTVIVQTQTRDGKKILEIYEKIGAMFENDNEKESAPDWTGKIFNPEDKTMPYIHPPLNKRIAAWRRSKDGKPYLSFLASDPQGNDNNLDDKIPF